MELLPCPFCGRDGGRIRPGHQVLCAWCWAEGPEEGTTDEAMSAWNRRAANAPADPALLALARFGADVIASHRGPTGKWAQPSLLALPDIARDLGVTISGQFAPGIASAIAALLAPDGAASEGVSDGD